MARVVALASLLPVQHASRGLTTVQDQTVDYINYILC